MVLLLLRLVSRLLRVQLCLLMVVLLLLQLLLQRVLLGRLCLVHSWGWGFLLLLGTLLWLLHGLAADPEAASCPVHAL